MIYKWTTGAHFNANAQAVGEELEKIKDRKALEVLRFAEKRKKSELYKCFEWDDSRAAHAHRMQQASQILLSVLVEYKLETETEPVYIRAFSGVYTSDADGLKENRMTYVPTTEALSDEEMRVQVLSRIRSDIFRLQEEIRTYSGMIPQLEGMTRKLEELNELIPV